MIIKDISNKQLVFGLGTGRCGTASLAYFLNAQINAVVFHEMDPTEMSWEGAEPCVYKTVKTFDEFLSGAKRKSLFARGTYNKDTLEKIEKLEEVHLIGDIASYYLPYVRQILEINSNVKFVGLKRDENETVKSFIKKTEKYRGPKFLSRLPGMKKNRNHWIRHNGWKWNRDPFFDKCFPKYDVSSKVEALHCYWNEYYNCLENLSLEFPEKVKIWWVDELNEIKGQKSILDFLNLKPDKHVYLPGVKVNSMK